MSILYRDQRQCAICHTYTTFTCINSKFIFDDLDLDGRPYDMSLVVLPYWVQHCSKCHYCTEDIRIVINQAADIIKTAAYTSIINDQALPYLAREYIAASYLARFASDYRSAGINAQRATWKCEDIQHPLKGVIRQQAIDNLLLALQHNQSFAPTACEQFLVVADLYRRHGEFNSARQYNQMATQAHPTDAVRVAIEVQIRAIEESSMVRIARPYHA